MSWKYRKRIRVIPGFRLNLSKTGMSATVGMKGFNVNLGRNGTYLNTGIPGSGVYDRVKLGGGKSSKPAPQNEDAQNFQMPTDGTTVEIKSFAPELITSDGLYGLKETILKAREIKKELGEESEKATSQKNWALFIAIISHLFVFGIFIKWFRDNYKTCNANAKEAKETYENFKVDIDFNMDPAMLNDYIFLKNMFERVSAMNTIWDVTSAKDINRVRERSAASTLITRTKVCFSFASLDFINTKYLAFKIQNANGGDLYFYPGFVIMPSEYSKDFAVIDIRDITLNHRKERFVETDSVPFDSKIVDRTWQYVNKNGLPDGRYKYNPEIPIALYYGLDLKSPKGLFESYQFSNADLAEKFCIAFVLYQDSLRKMEWDTENTQEKPTEYKLTCPYCQRHLEADEDLLGLTVECPACHKQLKLPEASN